MGYAPVGHVRPSRKLRTGGVDERRPLPHGVRSAARAAEGGIRGLPETDPLASAIADEEVQPSLVHVELRALLDFTRVKLTALQSETGWIVIPS